MKSVDRIYQGEFESKKSKFIGFVCPFFEFKNLLESLKKEHLKAVHFVYAFRYLNEHAQIIEDKSDDNEPRGSGGVPVLNVLRGENLINVAVIVVRYFGGIKLGVGGLVRAYTAATNEALKGACFCELRKPFVFELPLNFFARAEHFLRKERLVFEKKFTDQRVQISALVNEKEQENLQEFLAKIPFSL